MTNENKQLTKNNNNNNKQQIKLQIVMLTLVMACDSMFLVCESDNSYIPHYTEPFEGIY